MNNNKTIVSAIIACLLWSTAFVGIKYGMHYSKPFQFAGLRFFISGLMVMPFCGGYKNYINTISKNIVVILKVSFFQTFLLYGLFYIGISLVPGAVTAIVIGASPLFAMVVAKLTIKDEKVGAKNIIAIVLGLIGVIIISISRYQFSDKFSLQVLGIVLLLLSNISSAFGNVLVSKHRNNIDPFILNSAQIALGGLFLFFVSIPTEGWSTEITNGNFLISLLWLSFISAAAFSIWFKLLQQDGVRVSEINIWKFIIPVFGAILSWILIPEEIPEWGSISGMIIITIALILLNIKAFNGKHKLT